MQPRRELRRGGPEISPTLFLQNVAKCKRNFPRPQRGVQVMLILSTFSIAARCPRTGMVGVAVCTAVPAVGALCPFARPRVGAVATQSFVNPYLGIDGLKLLEQGLNAQETLERLIANDPGREVRQLSVVDSRDRAAAFTGESCIPWCGHS